MNKSISLYKLVFGLASVGLIIIFIFLNPNLGKKEAAYSTISYLFFLYFIYGYFFQIPIEIPGARIMPDDSPVLRIGLLIIGIMGVVLIFVLAK